MSQKNNEPPHEHFPPPHIKNQVEVRKEIKHDTDKLRGIELLDNASSMKHVVWPKEGYHTHGDGGLNGNFGETANFANLQHEGVEVVMHGLARPDEIERARAKNAIKHETPVPNESPDPKEDLMP